MAYGCRPADGGALGLPQLPPPPLPLPSWELTAPPRVAPVGMPPVAVGRDTPRLAEGARWTPRSCERPPSHRGAARRSAAPAPLGYDRFLLALADQQVAPRAHTRHAPLIRAARGPARQAWADVDFSGLPPRPKPQGLELARGE